MAAALAARFGPLRRRPSTLRLEDGSRISVIGCGPAGSFFSYFLLEMADRAGLQLEVDIYESRDFMQVSPQGCNMCGGIVSESLVQNLAAEHVDLPPTVVQRGIDSYVLHMDVGTVRIETPLHEMRIGAVHRGSGPRDLTERKWESFDHHLQTLALSRGARLVAARVDDVKLEEGRPVVRTRDGTTRTYDLVAVASGVNSSTLNLFEALNIGYRRPTVTKTLIREYRLGEAVISQTIGNSMHVFLLKIPRLEFAAIIPKGDYVTMCLLGENIDSALFDSFANSPEVKQCMPSDWRPEARSCQCLPHINIRGVAKPYGDRIVFIGDCGVTRLYKDGIGAAYRTAKAAARTAVFQGVSGEAFRRHYLPVCRTITHDNLAGRLAFFLVSQVQRARFLRRAVLRMTALEQSKARANRRLSGILWDMFTGSAPYGDVFLRMLRPAFIGNFLGSVAAAAISNGLPRPREARRL